MEAVGAASAIADLAGLAMKASIAAKHVVQSFINAPTELVHLSAKVDRMRALIDQVDEMNKSLPISDNSVLLTPEHQEMLFLGFRKNFETLGRIQSLCGLSEANSRRARVRFHWAVFDKRKATRILKESRILEMDLDIPLHILGMRVALLNHNAISIVGASQTLLHTQLTDSFQDIKIWMRSEMGSLLDDKLHSALDGPKLLPDLDCGLGTASRPAAKESKGLIAVQDLGRYPGTEPQPSSLLRNRQAQPEYRTPNIQLIEHDMRRTLQSYSSVIGRPRSLPDVTGPKATIGAQVILDLKRRRRRARIVVSAAFRLFCGRVLQFELQAQLTARRWTITPWLGCSMRLYNLRPSDAPIFLACKNRDFEEVRYLLESGEASIYDGDEEIGGLIDHVVVGWDRSNDIARFDSARPFLGQGELLLEHLLDQGCDPQLNNGKLYAFSFAFQNHYKDAIWHLMRHVADDETVLYLLAGRLESHTQAEFEWQVNFLRSSGFSDWKLESHSNHLLYGACWVRNLEEVLFALELAGIDPNLTGDLNRSAIGNAAQVNWIEGLAVLIECGAKVNTSEASWNGPPLMRCMFRGRMDEAAHYLLLHGADTTTINSWSKNAWNKIWDSGEDLKTWSYIDFERDVTHLLLHNADPFEIFTTKELEEADVYFPQAFDLVGQIRAAEMARARSYDQNLSEWADDFDYEYYEEAENSMEPHFFATWSNFGEIYHAKDNDSVLSDDEDGPTDEEYESSSDEDNSSDGGDSTSHCYSHDDYASSTRSPRSCASDESPRNDGVGRTSELNHENNDNEVKYCSDSGSAFSSSSSERSLLSLAYNHPPRAVGFFRNTTSFYSHISNLEGRRQMSRFPAVRAFCDALQNAGYRAQMDDNGDIWYDCEDGDRYFDAQEFRPAGEPSDWLVEACPICQDFERFGLGHVLKWAENGKCALREYRDKVKEKRRNYI